jgi:hypothetical protein
LLLEERKKEFPNLKNIIMECLECLTFHFDRYIALDVTKHILVCSPFGTEVKDLADNISNTAALQDHLSQVLNDKSTRYNFEQQTVLMRAFWIREKKGDTNSLKWCTGGFTTLLYNLHVSRRLSSTRHYKSQVSKPTATRA